GMRVLGYDKYVPEDEVRRRGAEPVKSLEALLPQVDVLTCHTPLTPETKHMINAKSLALMKPGAIYVNTSRGPVQDERALFEALTRGRLGARTSAARQSRWNQLYGLCDAGKAMLA